MAKKAKSESKVMVQEFILNKGLEGTLVFRQVGAILENTMISYGINKLFVVEEKSLRLLLTSASVIISDGVLHFSGENPSTGLGENWDFFVKGQKVKFTGAK